MSFSKLTEVIIVDLVPGGRFLVEDKVQERWPLLQGMINHEVKLIYGLRGEVRSGLLSWHRANIILEISTLEEAQEEAPDVATAEPEPEIRVEVIGRVRKIEVAVLLPLTYVIKLLLVDGRALVCRQDQCAEYDKLFNIEGKVIRVSVVKDSVREIVSIEDEEHDETATRDVSANEAKAEMA